MPLELIVKKFTVEVNTFVFRSSIVTFINPLEYIGTRWQKMKINDWANILRGCAEIIKTDTTDEVTGLSTLRETVNGVPVNMTLEVIARKLDELSKDIQRCSDMSVHFVEKNDHRTTNDGLCYFLGSVEATFEMDSQLLTRLHKIESDLFEERKKIVAKKISP